MDWNPFAPLGSGHYDVLHLYDFRDMQSVATIYAALEPYDECVLLAWSMGVWGGQRLFLHHANRFDRIIAINGTLCPVDNRYGIPRDLFAGTMAGWSESSRRKFYRRLTGGGEIEQKFLKHQPRRTLVDQQLELAYYLADADCTARQHGIYREVVICDHDRIVPTANQLSYWGNDIVLRAGGHFPFYSWKDWGQLLSEIHSK